jgi:hypothetical protein
MVFSDSPQDVVSYRLPRLLELEIAESSFCACPGVILQGLRPAQLMANFAIYQLALERARIDLQPSLLERDLLGVWN